MSNRMKTTYEKNKSAKVGENCVCPSCGTEFAKGNYQQAFCKSKGGTVCKDRFWNMTTPSKRDNRTRISPANALYRERVIMPAMAKKSGYPDVETMRNAEDEFDGSWDAHYAHTGKCTICNLKYEYCECGEAEAMGIRD